MLPTQQLVPCLRYLGLAPFLVAVYLSGRTSIPGYGSCAAIHWLQRRDSGAF